MGAIRLEDIPHYTYDDYGMVSGKLFMEWLTL